MSLHLLLMRNSLLLSVCLSVCLYRSGSISADDVRAVCKVMKVDITEQELESLVEK